MRNSDSISKKNNIMSKVMAMIIALIMIVSTPLSIFASESSDSASGNPGNEMSGNPGSAPGGNPPEGAPGGSPGGAPGSSASDISWNGATEITGSAEQNGKTYTSASADENALLIDTSETVTINNATVSKTGGTSASDNYSFYGINSGIMCKGGGTTNITGATITTDAEGANGVFSYGANIGSTNAAGDGTTVNISNSKITTTGNGSGGIMTTYGGTTNASNLTVTTSGGSSAPIRTDRGGGWVTVEGGTYTSSGQGSPAIYSTADVKVSGATLVSKASEGAVIEGTGSISLTDTDLTATNNTLNGNAQFYDTVMIYQSMSGDADSGQSSFTMTGGNLTSNKGHTFHVTNTNAVINLNSVNITNSSDNVLLSVCDDGWSGGSNIAELNASDQKLEGDILVGSDSKLTMTLSDNSTLTGSIGGSITNAKGTTVSTEAGTVNMTVNSGSVWVLTDDSYVTSLSGSGNINYNGHTLYINGKAYTAANPYSGLGSTTETSANSGTSGTSAGSDTNTSGTNTDQGENAGAGTGTAAKKANTLTASGRTVNVKYSAVKKAKVMVAASKAYSVKKAKGTVTYTKLSGNTKIKVNEKTGAITVKRGLKKGTYKIKVRVKAAGNSAYKAKTKTVTVTVNVE